MVAVPRVAPGSGTPNRAPLTVAAICAVGLACIMFDQTSLVVAVATIGRDLDAGIAGLQWLTAVSPLVAASTMPISAALATRLGTRNTLRGGLVVFALGAAVAASSTSLEALLVARTIQGLGAALILPNGPGLLGGNVPQGAPRQRAVGAWIVIGSVGLLLGPLVGGIVVEEFGWRVTFLMLIPLSLLGATASSLLDNTRSISTGRLDVAGLVAAFLMLSTLSWALIETGRGDVSAVLLVAGYAFAAAMGYTFVRIERRADNPVMDLKVLGSPQLRILLPLVLTYNTLINGSAFVISIYLQEGRHLSVATTGSLLLVANLGMPLAGPVVTFLRRFARPSTLMLSSLGLLTAAFLVMSLGTVISVPLFALPLLALGLCSGILYSIDTITVLDGIDGPGGAAALAALALMRQVGTVLGIAALASIGQVAVSLGIAARGEQTALLVAGGTLALITIRMAPRLRQVIA